MPNIKFNYLYRDSANYKKFGFVIFNNPTNRGLTELETLIKSKLVGETWFYAHEWKLQELFSSFFDFRVDPTWHEFESVEYTNEPANIDLNLKKFIATIEKLS
jgi:hypothetical protein